MADAANPTPETPQAPETPVTPVADELDSWPAETRETARKLAETVSKANKREQAEIAFAAIEYQKLMQAKTNQPATPEPKPKARDEDDDDPIAMTRKEIAELRAEMKQRDERERNAQAFAQRDAQMRAELARDPLTKDDAELADTIYDAALAKSLRTGGDAALHVKREIEKHRKRDEKRDADYLKRKTADAEATRGEGGARSPASTKEKLEMKGFGDKGFADAVIKKHGL